MSKPARGTKTVRILDPIHGFIKLREPELAVIDTPVFQRLRFIRQLASAYLAYPGANHTRFEHSVGVMYVSGMSSSVLVEKGYLGADEQNMVRLGALMHDIGHGPFSHVLDELVHEKSGTNHEDTGQRIIRKTAVADALSAHGYSPKTMSDLAVGKLGGKKKFMNELVAGGLSADLMDYLLRDSYFTGAGFGRVDIERVIDSFDVFDDHLAVEKDALNAFESLSMARYEMFKAVYFHKTVRAGEAMILRVFQLADERLGFSDTSDLERYVESSDESVLRQVLALKDETGPLATARGIARNYVDRRLVKCVYEKVMLRKERIAEKILSRASMRDQLRSDISSKASVDPDLVYIDLPTAPSVPYTSDRETFTGLTLLSHDSTGRRVERLKLEDIPAIQAISGYLDVLRVYTTAEHREKVEKAAMETLGEENYSTKISV
ncbi:MAG: HD domain-containing protein [Nitrososphaerota archaeon]|nr:HD domain-containing protein [Nitrososphaerota archaeon]MDG6939101.1 HD domain-containing protein [Nitrososphaerota archaeon]